MLKELSEANCPPRFKLSCKI